MCKFCTDQVYLHFILIPRLYSFRISQKKSSNFAKISQHWWARISILCLTHESKKHSVSFSSSLLLFLELENYLKVKVATDADLIALDISPYLWCINFSLIWQMSDAKKIICFFFSPFFSHVYNRRVLAELHLLCHFHKQNLLLILNILIIN